MTKVRSFLARGRRATRRLSPPVARTAPGAAISPAGVLQDVSSLLPRSEGPRTVVVVAHPSRRSRVPHWLDEFSGDRLHVLARSEVPEWELARRGARFIPVGKIWEVEEALRRVGRVDVVVSLVDPARALGGGRGQFHLFRNIFWHVAAGGMYVLDREAAPPPDVEDFGLDRLTRLLDAAEDRQRARKLGAIDTALADAVGAVIVTRDQIVVTKRFDHFFKMRDADVEEFLAVREKGLRVETVDSQRGGVLESRATVRVFGDDSDWRLPAELPYPSVRARHYAGRIASSGSMLLYSGRTILPDSFRWHLSESPGNMLATTTSAEFARIESRYVPERHLPGTYYLLDCIHSGHFGHLTTEVVSRFWGWDAARKAFPDIKVLFHLRRENTRDPKLELELLSAYGIEREDVTWVNEPVWLESVVAATPMWHNAEPFYAHPGMTDVWQRMTERLLTRAPDVGQHERIFVSRGADLARRQCRNQDEVEAWFEDEGFTIVYPERHSLPEQTALFAGARVVAGFAGSAMFNLMHAQRLETTIALSHDSYQARNEQLFAALLGGRLDYFRAAADISDEEPGSNRDAVRSSWAFDFDRFGADLARAVREA